jgi:hypothetical protein
MPIHPGTAEQYAGLDVVDSVYPVRVVQPRGEGLRLQAAPGRPVERAVAAGWRDLRRRRNVRVSVLRHGSTAASRVGGSVVAYTGVPRAGTGDEGEHGVRHERRPRASMTRNHARCSRGGTRGSGTREEGMWVGLALPGGLRTPAPRPRAHTGTRVCERTESSPAAWRGLEGYGTPTTCGGAQWYAARCEACSHGRSDLPPSWPCIAAWGLINGGGYSAAHARPSLTS